MNMKRVETLAELGLSLGSPEEYNYLAMIHGFELMFHHQLTRFEKSIIPHIIIPAYLSSGKYADMIYVSNSEGVLTSCLPEIAHSELVLDVQRYTPLAVFRGFDPTNPDKIFSGVLGIPANFGPARCLVNRLGNLDNSNQSFEKFAIDWYLRKDNPRVRVFSQKPFSMSDLNDFLERHKDSGYFVMSDDASGNHASHFARELGIRTDYRTF